MEIIYIIHTQSLRFQNLHRVSLDLLANLQIISQTELSHWSNQIQLELLG